MMIKFMVFIFIIETFKITARPSSDFFEFGFSNWGKREVGLKNSSAYPVVTEKSLPDSKPVKEGLQDMGSATESITSVYQTDVEPSGINKSFQLTDLLKNNSSYAATLLQYGINLPNNVLTCNNVSVINVNITLLSPNCNCGCIPPGPGSNVSVIPSVVETVPVGSATQQIEGSTEIVVEGFTGIETTTGEISTSSLTNNIQIEGITGAEAVTGESLSTVSITNTIQTEGLTGTEVVTGETLSTVLITNTIQTEGPTGTEVVTGEVLSTISITNTTQIEGVTESITGTEGLTGENLITTVSNITEEIETVTGAETVSGEIVTTTVIAAGTQEIEGPTESIPTNFSTEVPTGEVSVGELLGPTAYQSTPVTVSEISPVDIQSLPYYTTCITIYGTMSIPQAQTTEINQSEISSTTSINAAFLQKNVSFSETKTTDGAISEADVIAIHSSSEPPLRVEDSTAHLIDSGLSTTSSMASDSNPLAQVSEGENVSEQVRDVTTDKMSELSIKSVALHHLGAILKSVTSPLPDSSQFVQNVNSITETTPETASEVVASTSSTELSANIQIPKSAKMIAKPVQSVKPKTHRRRRGNRYALNVKY